MQCTLLPLHQVLHGITFQLNLRCITLHYFALGYITWQWVAAHNVTWHFAIHYTTFCRNAVCYLHTSFHPSAPACIYTYIRTCVHSYKFACTVIGSQRLTSKFFKIAYVLTAISPAPSRSFSPSLLLHLSILLPMSSSQ